MMDVVPFKTSFIFGGPEWSSSGRSPTGHPPGRLRRRRPLAHHLRQAARRAPCVRLLPHPFARRRAARPAADAAAPPARASKVLPSACFLAPQGQRHRRRRRVRRAVDARCKARRDGGGAPPRGLLRRGAVVGDGRALLRANSGDGQPRRDPTCTARRRVTTWHRCARTAGAEVLIGSPIDNTTVLVDERMRPVPIGVPGRSLRVVHRVGLPQSSRPHRPKFVRNPYWPDMRTCSPPPPTTTASSS